MYIYVYIPESMPRIDGPRCDATVVCRYRLIARATSDAAAAAATSGSFAISAVCNLTQRYELDAISVGVSVAPH